MLGFVPLFLLVLSAEPSVFIPTHAPAESGSLTHSSMPALPKSWLRDDPVNSHDPSIVWIKATSELQPDSTEALEQATGRLSEAVVKVALSHAGGTLSEVEVRRHLLTFLNSPQAQRDAFAEQVVKPYGIFFRHHLLLGLPREALADWLRAVVSERQAQTRTRCAAAALTLFGWVCGLGFVIKLDRWTRGYRRPMILASISVVLVAATALAWSAVLV